MADKQEKDLIGGTPKRLRGLNANDESISSTMEDVFNALNHIVDSIDLGIGDTSKYFNVAYGAFIVTESKSLGSTAIVVSSFSRPVIILGDGFNLFTPVDTPMKISIIQDGGRMFFVNRTNSIVHLEIKWILK